MNSIWAVARHTFAQCLRMKIAVAFLLLLAGLLAVLPFVMKGDGTLAGSIRTCLSYSVRITGGLLSIVTVLVTVGVLSGDIREKYIFLLAAKPLARWKYLLGRWLGVVMLNAVLLTIAGASIYFVLQHFRSGRATSAIDRRAVETEIFTARCEIKPQPPNLRAKVEKRIEKLKADRRYAGIIKDFWANGNLSPDQAREKLEKQLYKEALSASEVAGPGGWLEWNFKGMDVAGESRRGTGKIVLLDKQRGLYRIEAPAWLAGQLFENGLIKIEGVSGKVIGIGPGRFDVEFSQAERDNAIIKDIRKDQDVAVMVEPTFQFRYKVVPIGNLPTGRSSVYRRLKFRRHDGAAVVTVASDSPIKTLTSVTVPAVESLRKGNIQVAYGNIPARTRGSRTFYIAPNPVQVSQKDVSILYRIGGFDANFFRAMLLIFCQLAFLAALGVFFGCFLSFPVASLACLVMLVCGWMMNWLAEAVEWSSKDGGFDFIGISGKVVLKMTAIFMPNLAETSPAERLVDGIFISWHAVGEAAVLSVAVRAVFFLAAACLIFHKRELARVQV